MNLMGRNLSSDMTGDDVMQLQSELRHVGFTIPEDERRRAFFGPGTREAVLSFQRAHGLPETGTVDVWMVAALEEAVAARGARPTPPPASKPAHAGTAHSSGGLAEPEPAVPTQPLPASAHRTAPGDGGQPAHGDSAPLMSGASASQPSAALPDAHLPTGVGNPLAGGGAAVPPTAGGSAAPPSGGDDAGGEFVVQGHVRLADGSPLAGVLVQAVAKGLRTEQFLGKAGTDVGGGYRIRYTAAQLSRAGHGTADLIVRAYNADGKLLTASPVMFNAPPTATIDLVVAAAADGVLSEYERYVNTLAPLLVDVAVPGVKQPTIVDRLAVLTADDLDFLTGETGIERQRLEFLVAAAILQLRSGQIAGAPAAHTDVPTAVFYGLAREGLGTDPAAMIKRGATAIHDALTRAIKNNIIPKSLVDSIDTLMAGIQRLVVQAVLRDAPDGLHPLGDLLRLSLPAEKQATLLALHGAHQGTIQQFWAAVRKHRDFQTPGLVDDLQLNLQLNLITQGHVPLVQALRQSYRFTSPRELARLTLSQWAELLNKQVNGQPVGVPADIPGATPQEQATNFVAGIVRMLQITYPTETVAQIVAQAPDIRIENGIRKGILQFFANSPEFDLLSTRVDAFLKQKGPAALKGIDRDSQAQVIEQVKRLQRVHHVSTSPDVMTTLLARGYDSAHAIASTPRGVFIERMQSQLGGAQPAQQVYDKARLVYSTMMHVVMTLYERFHGLRPAAMDTGTATPAGASTLTRAAATPNAASSLAVGLASASPNITMTSTTPDTQSLDLSQYPSLTKLFGSLDFCDCAECRSVLSPAAYLVDLLDMLDPKAQQRPPASLDPRQGTTPIEVLFRRRPDLQNIALTCENTNTPLPYIDLVNEILETWITSSVANLMGNPAPADTGAAGNNDTGDTSAAELRASPQYILDAVYDYDDPNNIQNSTGATLRRAIYPFKLPFNLPVETARVYLEFMGSSLFEVLSAFQPLDEVTVSAPENAQRTQAESVEYLKITREEYMLLTGQDFAGNQVSPSYQLSDYYGYPPTGSDLVSDFLTHTGVSMNDLIALIETHTCNPNVQALLTVQAVGLDYKTVNQLATNNWPANSQTATTIGIDVSGLTGVDYATFLPWAQKNYGAVQKTIVVAGDDCDTKQMHLQHQDGSALAESEWRWLYYFIRLWRKLGWNIADLDSALANWLVPNPSSATGADLVGAVRCLAVAAQLHDSLKLPIADVLALWVPFTSGAQGISPLYAKLFLNKAVQRIDLAFQPAWDGQLLAPSANLKISDQLPTLRAAFRVSEEDITALLAFMGKTGEDTFDLLTLSKLYRYVVLGRGLKLRIPDLISLVTLWGSEAAVFGKPSQQDSASTLRFVQMARAIKSSGFSIPELDYLYRQIMTPRTTFAPDAGAIGTTAQALRGALMQIPTDSVTVTDATGAVLRAQLQTSFTSDQIAQLMGILSGTDEYMVGLSGPLPYDNTTQKTTSDGPTVYKLSVTLPAALAFPRVGYVPQNTGASLYIDGALSDSDMQAAQSFASTDPSYQQVVLPALQAADGPYQAPRDFLRQQMFALLDTGQPGSDSIADAIDFLLNQPHTPEESYEFVLSRYRLALKRFDAVNQTLGAALKLDVNISNTLLESILKGHVDTQHPEMYDAVALATPGLSRTSVDSTGTQTAIDAAIAFDGTVVALPATTTTATWMGVILPPTDDSYTFYVRSTPGVSVQLIVNNQPITMTPAGTQPGEVSTATPLPLKATQPCYIQLSVQALTSGFLSIVQLRWSGATVTKATVPSANLYPAGVLESFFPTYVLLSKAALLVSGFHLTAAELAYLWAHGTDFNGFDPNKLPTNRSTPAQVDQHAPGLFQQWLRLRAYVALRDSLPNGGSTTLLDVFAAAAGRLPTALTDAQAALATLTGWDPGVLNALVTGFGLQASDLQTEVWSARLQTCMQLIQTIGASPVQLFDWSTRAVHAGTQSPGLTMDDAEAIKKVAKTGYDDDAWLTVAEPLNDPLRQRRRDALVAYILAQNPLVQIGVQTPDDLFDYFLIDVEMEPCMLTSRIKQATSSVQTFVQRCLLNLEQPNVSPNAIDPDVWQWKSRYRVWQANREVFLWPENWIVPELRDDKTPFFKDLESELLQSDITKDSVETAFLNYLTKLDEVKQLDICGLYWQDSDPDTGEAVNILHVFGRTNDLPHVYYYRQLVNNTTWTPWEKVPVDIESDHLIPVVWNRRLHIFWPIFTQKADTNDIPSKDDNPKPAKVYWDIKLAWSEYKQGKWQPKHVSSASISHPDIKNDSYKYPFLDLHPPGQNVGGEFVGRRYDILGYLYPQSTYTFKALVGSDGTITLQVYQSAPCWKPTPIPSDSDKDSAIWSVTYNGIPLAADRPPDRGPVKSIGDFHFAACAGEAQVASKTSQSLLAPPGADARYMKFVERGIGTDLSLYVGAFGDEPNPNPADERLVTFLTKTPSTYRLVYPHQYLQYALQSPFFYQDDQRTYCVLPSPVILSFGGIKWNDSIPLLSGAGTHQYANGASRLPVQLARYGGPPLAGPASQPQPALAMAPASGTSAHLPGTSLGTASRAVAQVYVAHFDWSYLETTRSANWAGTTELYTYNPWRVLPDSELTFVTHYHPYVCEFIKTLQREGIKGLLTPDMQRSYMPPSAFQNNYNPDLSRVDMSRTWECVDFGYRLGFSTSPVYSGQPLEGYGPYSIYNWELFFHAPLLLATRLSQNQHFDEAQTWFHYVFDPTNSSQDPAPQRYWRFLPFYNNRSAEDQSIQHLLEVLASSSFDPTVQAEKAAVVNQINQWTQDPFQPHALARLCITAYQKAVIMKYIDNLIAWGDQLFQQDTIESINEATQLYILAARLLGPRPQRIPTHTKEKPQTYASLRTAVLDQFANAVVAMENEFPFTMAPSAGQQQPSDDAGASLGLGKTLYFCIPPNTQLLGYWDTVADRLFKIRNCLNIEGIAQHLPLFEPPIDPMLLVQAVAQGVSLSTVLGDLSAPLPYYRFSYLLPKAVELCAEVTSLGAALLAAQEKADAEHLALMRASLEMQMLRDQIRRIKDQQIGEAQASVDALIKTQAMTQYRRDHYDQLINQGLSDPENQYFRYMDVASVRAVVEQGLEALAGALTPVPDVTVGGAGMASPVAVTYAYGGTKLAGIIQAAARLAGATVAWTHDKAAMVAATASYDRREQDWELQRDLAAKELEQIQKQLDGAKIRLQIAQWELENLDKQTDNAAAIEDFLRTKYTNEQLYQWMHSQLSAIYYQAYSLAFDLAKQAERAYRFERGLTDSNFVQFGTWDSQHDGLLAGEKLHLSLRQMEQAYLSQSSRDYEIIKHISLAVVDPLALIQLKETGSCEVELPEVLFDVDYPGHYMRRIKSVALTIPCVVGPYTSINCTLTLLSNTTRISSDAAGPDGTYAPSTDTDDNRFVDNFAATQSIATSHAQNDTGLFELNFRDERYLPFEGAGVISRWHIDLPRENNAFDFNTVTDVILRLQYSARDGGKALADAARASMQQDPIATSGARLFSAKHEFAASWIQFINAPTTTQLQLDFSKERFPYQLRGKTVQIDKIDLHLLLDGTSSGGAAPTITLTNTGAPADPLHITLGAQGTDENGNTLYWSGSLGTASTNSNYPTGALGGTQANPWALSIDALPQGVIDLLVVCEYSWT